MVDSLRDVKPTSNAFQREDYISPPAEGNIISFLLHVTDYSVGLIYSSDTHPVLWCEMEIAWVIWFICQEKKE